MDAGKQRELRDVSDQLIDELQGIKELETLKRHQEISTPAFHQLTDEVAERSQRVFQLAVEEDDVSDSFDEPQHRSVEDVPPAGDQPGR